MPVLDPVVSAQLFALLPKAGLDAAGIAAQKQFCDSIATVISTAIKSATIIVPPGQAVATAGSPVAQTGATVSPSPPAIIS